MATHFSILAMNPINSLKRQKDVTLEDEPPQVSRCPVGYWGRVEKQLQKE